MTTMLSAAPNRKTTTTRRPHPLLAVITWELRRLMASRSTWVLLFLAFGFFLLFIWLLWLSNASGITLGSRVGFKVAITSAEGLVSILSILSFLLVLILPFVNADGTARDLKQRTYELLMSAPLPSWAYIWGRYIARLLLSLCLTMVLLVALLLIGLILHHTQTDYPPPQLEVILMIWVVALVPTTILISSVSFVLGTMLQRHPHLVKMGMILGWLVCALILGAISPVVSEDTPSWYLIWEPTNIGMAALLEAPYLYLGIRSSTPITDSVIFSALTNLEQQVPNLGPYILPHLIWIGLALALVGFLARSFKRFSNSSN